MHFKINKKSKETQCIGSAYTTTNQKKVLKMLIFKLNILFQKSKNYLKLKLNIKSEKKKLLFYNWNITFEINEFSKCIDSTMQSNKN